MIKIAANLSKKVPIPGLEFSSQSFMAGIEVEVSDGTSTDQIRQRVREVYTLLEQSINDQLATHSPKEAPAYTPGSIADARRPSRLAVHATQAQVKAIYGIAKAMRLDRKELLDRIHADYHVNQPEELSIKQASILIEQLKAKQAAA